VGARATYVELAANHNTNSQNAVFLSARIAAKALGVDKGIVGRWLRELEHYGFIVEIQGAHLGLNGEGKAARYRLTDRWYASKEPTYDFQYWDGVLFEPKKRAMTEADKKRLAERRKKQKPVRGSRTPRTQDTYIRGNGVEPEKGNKRTPDTYIRAFEECTQGTDITSYTTPLPDSWYPENWTSQIIPGVAPHPIDIENGEADSPLWIDAWLEQVIVPVPTLSLSEIRASMGYRQ
jgi:hypothetical protein